MSQPPVFLQETPLPRLADPGAPLAALGASPERGAMFGAAQGWKENKLSTLPHLHQAEFGGESGSGFQHSKRGIRDSQNSGVVREVAARRDDVQNSS